MKIEVTIALAIDAPDEPDYPGQTPESYAENVARALVDGLIDQGSDARLIRARRLPEARPAATRDAALALSWRVLQAALLAESLGLVPTLH